MPRRHVVAALGRRELLIAKTYRPHYALAVVVGGLNLVVFFMIFRAYGGVRPAGIGTAPSYFAFVAVGVVVSVLQLALQGAAQRVKEEQEGGSLEILMTEPVRASEVAFGLMGVSLAIAVARAVLYLVFAVALLSLPLDRADALGGVLVAAAAVPSFVGLAALMSAVVLLIPRSQALSALAAWGLGLLSGAAFPISQLPDGLEALGRHVPTFFAFDGLRTAMFAGAGWGPATLALLAWGAVLLPLGLLAFAASLHRLRTRGSVDER